MKTVMSEERPPIDLVIAQLRAEVRAEQWSDVNPDEIPVYPDRFAAERAA
jgi:hypothetical protein